MTDSLNRHLLTFIDCRLNKTTYRTRFAFPEGNTSACKAKINEIKFKTNITYYKVKLESYGNQPQLLLYNKGVHVIGYK